MTQLMSHVHQLRPMYYLKTVLVIIWGCGEVFQKRMRDGMMKHLKEASKDWDSDLPMRMQIIGLDWEEDRCVAFKGIGRSDAVKFHCTANGVPWKEIKHQLLGPQPIVFICTPDQFHVDNLLEVASKFPDAIIAVEKPILNSPLAAGSVRELLADDSFRGRLIALEHYIAKKSFLELIERLKVDLENAAGIDLVRVSICEKQDNQGREVSHAYLDLSVHALLMAVRVFRISRQFSGPIRINATDARLLVHAEGKMVATAAEGTFTIGGDGVNSMQLEFICGKKTLDMKTLRLLSGDQEVESINFANDSSNAHELMIDGVMAGGSDVVFLDTHDAIDACEEIASEFEERSQSEPVKYSGPGDGSAYPFLRIRTLFEPR